MNEFFIISLYIFIIIIEFSITGAIAKTSFYAEHILPHSIFNMSCNGDEDSIYNCTYSSELPSGSRCYSGEDASVICQSKPFYTLSQCQ